MGNSLSFIKALLPKRIKSAYHKLKKWQNELAIKGSKVYCPICKSSFKYFGPFGYMRRNNAKCHNCGSLERHRLLFLFLKNKLNFFELKNKMKLLHFAPEPFFYDIFSNIDFIEYIPCDLHPENYFFKNHVNIVKEDITDISFIDNEFDFIICNQVLEHIPNDSLALRELFRVMKPGGTGIIQVPIDYNREKTYEDFKIITPEQRLKAFGHPDHVRWYGKD